MREIGIMMQPSSIRAIRAGRKTQTRRACRRENDPSPGNDWAECLCREIAIEDTPCVVCDARFGISSYGEYGDAIYVKEALVRGADGRYVYAEDGAVVIATEKRARGADWASCRERSTCQAMFMPKWAARFWLVNRGARVERLDDITNEDAIAEGAQYRDAGADVTGFPRPGWSMLDPHPIDAEGAEEGWKHCLHEARFAYLSLWNEINGKRGLSSESNPWVRVLTFELGEAPRG